MYPNIEYPNIEFAVLYKHMIGHIQWNNVVTRKQIKLNICVHTHTHTHTHKYTHTHTYPNMEFAVMTSL